ncbi:MAG: ribosomal protein S18-alanine N-acetyltransferase, partial [Clostridiales bacterium]|nr:ribosomal protein S18-alanine N-acetyltransferase [Clostridiales bacterium]
IKKDYNVSFVGRFLGKPVAYVFADMICGEIYVGKVAVDEKMRKHGYARQLIRLLIEFAKENSCSLMTLEVRDSNNAAINLYKKFGFECLGKRKSFYSKPAEDALIMTLYLK